MKINLKDKTTKEILAFSLLPFGTSTIYDIMATALDIPYQGLAPLVFPEDKKE